MTNAATPQDGSYVGNELATLADLVAYPAWIASLLAPWLAGNVVEVGAGLGTLSKHLRPAAGRLVLVEPDPRLASSLSRRFESDRDVVVVPGGLDDARARAPEVLCDDRFDVACSVNVLEHIGDDVGALRNMSRLVRPGGHLLTFVPALPAIYGTLDALVGHHRRYTRTTLRAAHEGAGLEVVAVHYVDSLGVLPWWVVGRLLRARSFDGALSRLYDRVGVPASRLCDRLLADVLGKNLFLVARRPT